MWQYIAVAFIAFATSSMSAGITTGGPHYYESFKTKSLPEVPTGPISREEAQRRESTGSSYYIAYFNESGSLTKMTKRRNGHIDWESEYVYEKGVLVQGRTSSHGSDGLVLIERTFGKKGEVVTRTRTVRR